MRQAQTEVISTNHENVAAAVSGPPAGKMAGERAPMSAAMAYVRCVALLLRAAALAGCGSPRPSAPHSPVIGLGRNDLINGSEMNNDVFCRKSSPRPDAITTSSIVDPVQG
jgi:hypothetical protein